MDGLLFFYFNLYDDLDGCFDFGDWFLLFGFSSFFRIGVFGFDGDFFGFVGSFGLDFNFEGGDGFGFSI